MGQLSRAASAWGLAAALMLLSSCASPYGQAMRRARQAEDLGNEKNALMAYREACALRGPGHRACDRAAVLTGTLAGRAVEAAEAVCMEGHVDRCTEALAAVAGPATDHPSVGALIERSMDAAVRWDAQAIGIVDACVPDPVGDVPALLAALACLEAARAAPIDRPAFRERILELGATLSAPLLALMADAPPGGRQALAVAATCVDRSDMARQRVAASRDAFLTASSRPLTVRLTWSGDGEQPPVYDGVCERVAAELLGVVCAEGEDALTLEASVREPPPTYRAHDQIEAVRYRSGTRIERNPDHDAAERRLDRAEYALAESEPAYHDWQAACDSAERQHRQANLCHDCTERENRIYHCERADSAKKVYERHAREVRDARSALNRTPATLEIAEYDVHRYSERHHRWTVDYAFSLEMAAPSTNGVEVAKQLAWRSSDRPAFAPAGIDARSRRDPPAGHFAEQIVGALVSSAAPLVRGAVEAGIGDPDVACDALDLVDWLDCRAEAALASGRLLPAGEAMTLLARRLGVTAPLLRCR
jgi:hypothetical protein